MGSCERSHARWSGFTHTIRFPGAGAGYGWPFRKLTLTASTPLTGRGGTGS